MGLTDKGGSPRWCTARVSSVKRRQTEGTLEPGLPWVVSQTTPAGRASTTPHLEWRASLLQSSQRSSFATGRSYRLPAVTSGDWLVAEVVPSNGPTP